jgi:hypothetical protein
MQNPVQLCLHDKRLVGSNAKIQLGDTISVHDPRHELCQISGDKKDLTGGHYKIMRLD